VAFLLFYSRTGRIEALKNEDVISTKLSPLQGKLAGEEEGTPKEAIEVKTEPEMKDMTEANE